MLCLRWTRLRIFAPNQEGKGPRDGIYDPNEKQHSWRIDSDDSEEHHNHKHIEERHSSIQVNVLG